MLWHNNGVILMYNGRGRQIEDKMKAWFRGTSHPYGCVDFQTSTSLYEVKSCKLFNDCNGKTNINMTHQLGRFKIDYENHKSLLYASNDEHKKAKYIFVVVIDKQTFWKTLSWHIVDKILTKRKGVVSVRIADIFYGW